MAEPSPAPSHNDGTPVLLAVLHKLEIALCQKIQTIFLVMIFWLRRWIVSSGRSLNDSPEI